jgi:ribonuclease PH
LCRRSRVRRRASIKIDCDVLQADGGTRCARSPARASRSPTHRVVQGARAVTGRPLREMVAAVSVGIVDGVRSRPDYAGFDCDTDMNV